MVFHIKRFFDLDIILNQVENQSKKKKKIIVFDEQVKVSSLRLFTFKEFGTKCVCCGREGSHFRLQKSDKDILFHLGLWSDDGVEITKDHIVPKSKGGLNTIGNMQTMCKICNNEKDDFVTDADYENGEYKEIIK